MIKAILFDVIGTTVLEKDSTVINSCFEQAFMDHQLSVSNVLFKENRGKDKEDAIRNILIELDRPSHLGDKILRSFRSHLLNNIDSFYENPGLRATVDFLKKEKIKIGIGTGLSKDIFEKIIDHLKWKTTSFDYIGVAGQIGKGRPHPDMIYDMIAKCNIRKEEFLKVGDTVADIREGKNAGVKTAVIFSGTQDENSLIMEHPDYCIRSLTELMGIVK